MNIRLTIRCFRNLDTTVTFDRFPVLVIGKNGSGKTSLLEAIYWIAYGRSFRSKSWTSVVRSGQSQAGITLERIPEGDRIDLVIGPKRSLLLYQGKPISFRSWRKQWKVFHLGGRFWDQVVASSGWRRKMMDNSLSALDPTYPTVINRFKRILNQWNAVLKSGIAVHTPEAQSWETRFLMSAKMVWSRRTALICAVEPILARFIQRIFPGIHIRVGLRPGGLGPIRIYENTTLETIRSARRFPVRSETLERRCLIGPQRDDLVAWSDHGSFWETASGGQIRALLMAWSLALDDLARMRTGQSILLLIDDFDSELDVERRTLWMKLLQDREAVVTSSFMRDEGSLGGFRLYRLTSGAATGPP